MKRFIAATLTILMLWGLCACGDGGSANTPQGGSNQTTNLIAEELQGTWYGPNSQPVLNINTDGTGTVTLENETHDASFTAENDVFTIISEGYNLSGNYTSEDEKLTVKPKYDDTEYTLIFTRTPVELPEGSFIYNYNDETYEINFDEGEVLVCEFPPKDEPPTIEVYFEYVNETIINVYPEPPVYIFTGETITGENTTPGFPHPEQIDISNTEAEITIGGETTPGYSGGDDIVGTWTTIQEGTVSFFGVTNEATVPITYTFNADGTGTVVAMGIFTGTLTYSVENGVLNLTVSMLGDTESGTGYVQRVGDTLYVKNVKDEIEILSKVG